MKKLVEIVIRCSIHKIGYRADVKKIYNSVKLVKDDCGILGKRTGIHRNWLRRKLSRS